MKAEPQDMLRTPVRQRAMITCTYLVYPSHAPIPVGMMEPDPPRFTPWV